MVGTVALTSWLYDKADDYKAYGRPVGTNSAPRSLPDLPPAPACVP